MNNKIRRAMNVITEQFAIIEAELSHLPVPGDPAILSMTMREFVCDELLQKRRLKNFGFKWTDGEAMMSSKKFPALSH